MAATEVVRCRIDEEVKEKASRVLAESGLTVSDAIRMFMARIADEGQMPNDWLDGDGYTEFVKAATQEALDDPTPPLTSEEARARMQTFMQGLRDARTKAA